MPMLKQLNCQIKWSGSNRPMKEYEVRYEDGRVQCYVHISDDFSSPFFIHLTSQDEHIAPGLAMFVYMDGEYQCNRNRRANITFPAQHVLNPLGEVDIKVRQKEVLRPDGSMWGRQWRFSKLAEADSALETTREPPDMGASVGTIEVLVLRCAIDDSSSQSSGSFGPPPDAAALGLKPGYPIHADESPAQASAIQIPGAWPPSESRSSSNSHQPGHQDSESGTSPANQKSESPSRNTAAETDSTEQEEALFAMHLHADAVNTNLTSHQVRPGKAAPYLHRLVAPEYFDTQEKPYASFVFKYRSAASLEKILGIIVEESEEEREQQYQDTPKFDLIKELLHVKAQIAHQHSDQNGGSDRTDPLESVNPPTTLGQSGSANGLMDTFGGTQAWQGKSSSPPEKKTNESVRGDPQPPMDSDSKRWSERTGSNQNVNAGAKDNSHYDGQSFGSKGWSSDQAANVPNPSGADDQSERKSRGRNQSKGPSSHRSLGNDIGAWNATSVRDWNACKNGGGSGDNKRDVWSNGNDNDYSGDNNQNGTWSSGNGNGHSRDDDGWQNKDNCNNEGNRRSNQDSSHHSWKQEESEKKGEWWYGGIPNHDNKATKERDPWANEDPSLEFKHSWGPPQSNEVKDSTWTSHLNKQPTAQASGWIGQNGTGYRGQSNISKVNQASSERGYDRANTRSTYQTNSERGHRASQWKVGENPWGGVDDFQRSLASQGQNRDQNDPAWGGSRSNTKTSNDRGWGTGERSRSSRRSEPNSTKVEYVRTEW